MYKYDFKNVVRVNKNQARQIFKYGFDVLFIPHKCDPENDFHSLGIWENISNENNEYKTDFDKLLNAFSWYNCNYNELGKYPAFYISKTKVFIHFSFDNGSNPYIFRGSILECLNELKRWKKNFEIEYTDFSLSNNKTTGVYYKLYDLYKVK